MLLPGKLIPDFQLLGQKRCRVIESNDVELGYLKIRPVLLHRAVKLIHSGT